MFDQISEIKSQLEKDLEAVQSKQGLENVKAKYLSKKSGQVTGLMSTLQGLTLSGKQEFGPKLNTLKKEVELALSTKESELNNLQQPKNIDLTIPLDPAPAGRLHPTTIIIQELNDFFRHQGFSIGEGPEIEEVEYNFRRLNLPDGHPATDLQDSLYIHEPELLLRTQTSSIETRILSTRKPPLRVVAPGKCYRNETNTKTNNSFFYQYQGFVVDKGINIQNLIHTITTWFQFLWGEDVKIRFRYKYYPEVTPGLGQDIECSFCRGQGCAVCKYRGWIEMGGAGMIHPNTLLACGIDPTVYTGFAFGVGLDRMVMTKFGITDIRKLYSGDIVYK